MKSLRLDRWASNLHPPRNPRLYLLTQRCPYSTASETRTNDRRRIPSRPHHATSQWQPQRRCLSHTSRNSAVAAVQRVDENLDTQDASASEAENKITEPNFPLHARAKRSAKLSALHARLSLPAKLPVETLARCLIDRSVDPRPGYNNAPMAILGQELLGYYTSEHLITHYPRLPMTVLYAAQYAYVGPATLAAIRQEWGVEVVAAPGPEVDPGLLQLKRMTPGNAMATDGISRIKDLPLAQPSGSGRRNDHYRRGISSRIVYDDQFGDLHSGVPPPEEMAPFAGAPISVAASGEGVPTDSEEAHFEVPTNPAAFKSSMETTPVTVEEASAGFVRAVMGALYLHAGTQAAKDFHKAHILSRHLELHKLFNFRYPTRDLAFLCKREGFEPPVARIISETGRLSRTPVFLIGVFSGNNKLGEAEGASLNEGRVRAAAAALRAWYLYSPMTDDIVLPSDVDGADVRKPWKPQHIDPGEIVT